MQVTTFYDVTEDVHTAIKLANARRLLAKALREAQDDQLTRLRGAQAAFLTQPHAMDEGFQRMNEVVCATDGLPDLHELLAQQWALETRLRAHSPQALRAAKAIDELHRAELPKTLVSPELAATAAAARVAPEGLGLEPFLAALLRPAPERSLVGRRDQLRRLHRSRLRYLHRHLMTQVAATSPEVTPPSLEEVDLPSVAPFAEAARHLRRAAKRLGEQLASDHIGPAGVLELWQALGQWEQWMMGEASAGLTRALACAGVPRSRSPSAEEAAASSTFAWARTGAQLYDELRRGFAYSAALREALIALALHDEQILSRWAKAADLPLASAQLDLRRSSVTELPSVEEGALVEVDGRISQATFRPGGPEPRTALELTGATGDRATVIVPYASVDSFGIETGVWVQVRGTYFPGGKYDLDAPLIQVRRIKQEAAAKESFSDFLTWSGRPLFEMRPGGYDLVAGRLAGSQNAVNEHVVRPGVPEASQG